MPNTEPVAKPHQSDWHLYRLPCITLCTTMQGKRSPNYTEVDCEGSSTSATTSYAPYRQTCQRKLCPLGVLEYKTVHTDAQHPLLHHRATLRLLFEVASYSGFIVFEAPHH